MLVLASRLFALFLGSRDTFLFLTDSKVGHCVESDAVMHRQS